MHVDLVKNDWALRVQICMGRVVAVGNELLAKEVQQEYSQLVDAALARVDSRRPVDDQLFELGRILSGTHLFFSEPHDEPECPFGVADAIQMEEKPFLSMPA